MAFKPTAEQELIVNSAKELEDNLLIRALAGAAKTSTLVLVAEALPTTQILCLAFNKRIATEMQERLPNNCTAQTLNSIGHRVWGEAIGRRLQISSSKTYDILTSLLEATQDQFLKKEGYENLADLIRTVDFGKACGFIPTGHYDGPPFRAKRLMDTEEFFSHLDEELPDYLQDLIVEATLVSLKIAFEGKCDYGDQILMPTVFHGAFPRFPLVLIDEAQDLSALNHAMLRKLVKKRLIAVGDENQAIYGFRGAHENSMSLMREEFEMKELTLSVSFRCPISVVKTARSRAPQMQWPEWAKEGEVRTWGSYTADEIPDDSAVICRNNAPLFNFAIKLLKNGRYAELYGNDIGKSLLKLMKKLGPESLSQNEVFQRIADWEEEKLKKAKNRGEEGIRDRAECLRIFARQGKNLGEAMAYAQHVFNARGPLKLMTGHKSKGLEFDNVFFLDEHLVGDKGQDPNLRYVIITRAKETLTYIRSDDFLDA